MKFEVRVVLKVDDGSSRLSLGYDEATEEVREAVLNALYDLDDMKVKEFDLEQHDK